MTQTRAEIVLPTVDLPEDISFWTRRLGFRMETIHPADDPSVAVFSGHGLRVRLDKAAETSPGLVRLLSERPDEIAEGARRLVAPNGTRIEIEALNPPFVLPETAHAFVVRRLADQAPWVIGRAGMQYRDLIPDRLGGAIIASHIRIPDGGPVPDMVHYHTVGFQLIFCYRGWVDLVYEDQGPPFRLTCGQLRDPAARDPAPCAFRLGQHRGDRDRSSGRTCHHDRSRDDPAERPCRSRSPVSGPALCPS